ncbi:MAG: choice-of-anchor J domain-containing protein [Deltaproteobacteria bacterium]|nr:choice-of-anchor J domain-containing protein [Deltaproteobacteria bacterium]
MKRSRGRLWMFGLVGAVAGLAVPGCDDGRKNNGDGCETDDECGSGFCLVVCLDPDGDSDGDGLINRREKELSTSLDTADTDGDGVDDFTEVGDVFDTPTDSDGDGIIDARESSTADADGDCVADQFDAESETHAELVATHCALKGLCAEADPAAITLSCPRGIDGQAPECSFAGVPGYSETDAVCDGVDANCDGATDEDFVGEACERTNAFGACSGLTVCESGVPGCGAAEPAGEVCDGVDQDCDGETDETTCDDGDACTEDLCEGAAGCTNTAKDCDDGDACTVDSCDASTGACVHGALSCDDADPCTVDSCDAATGCTATAVDCGDGDPCTDDTCDPTTGACANAAVDCDDSNPCTVDTCDATMGACQHVAKVCDDGDPCTDDACDVATGACAAAPIDCDDADPCTSDGCDSQGGQCTHTEDVCDDGDPCTDDVCGEAGACGHTPVDCSDGDACNGAEFCEPGVGCQAPVDTVLLEDFESGAAGWSTGVVDASGQSANSWALVSETGGTSAQPLGSTAYGALNTGDQLGYERSYLESPSFDVSGGAVVSFRTFVANEAFQEGESVEVAGGGTDQGGPLGPGDPIEYAGLDMEFFQASYDGGVTWHNLLPPVAPQWESLAEYVDVSVEVPAAQASADTRFRFVFDTGDDCCGPEDVFGWFIDDFEVRSGGALVCGAGDACETVACDAALGCVATPLDLDCDDSDACTVDFCHPEAGCVSTYIGDTCDDGDLCTVDGCNVETGCTTEPVSCADDDACTDESCDPATGCLFAPVDCDDGDVCNGEETCDSSDGCLSAQPVVYLEDFDGEVVDGWVTGALDGSVESVDSWFRSSESGGEIPVSFDSLAFGNANNGGQFGFEQSFLESPEFDLTGGAVITFRTFVSNEDAPGGPGSGGESKLTPSGGEGSSGPDGPLSPDEPITYTGLDMEFFQISVDGGETWSNLLPPTAEVWQTQEPPGWVTVTVSIPTAQASATTRFRFLYDTGDSCCGPVDVVGWFIDDFEVSVGGPLVCDGTDLCASTSCDAVSGCQEEPLDLDCDDADACTLDFCHPEVGCVNTSITYQCDDGDACNGLESCLAPIGCTPPVSAYYADDFEFSESGWSAGPFTEGDSSFWDYAETTGGTAPVSFDSLAFGTPNAGSELGLEHSVVSYFTAFDLSGGGHFRFRSYTANDDWNTTGTDAESVEISTDGGESWSVLIDPTDPRWMSVGEWVQFDVAFDPAPGMDNVAFRFVYDTVDACCGPNDVAGWFLDDVETIAFGVFSCDDGDPCTIDSCDPATGCAYAPDPTCQ